MRALLDGKEIAPSEVSLDDLAFDRGTPGRRVLVLELDASDLHAIGTAIFEYACTAKDEEPAYFSHESMRGVPEPRSADFLRHDPDALVHYLSSSFWSREVVVAIVTRAGHPGYPATAACRITRFTSGKQKHTTHLLVLRFEAS